jgi:hypothetical protein
MKAALRSMFRRRLMLGSVWLLGAALVAWPSLSRAESAVAKPGGSASASLQFRIIIPPVLRVVENSHPPAIAPDAAGQWQADQRLVVFSNLKQGFCATLRLQAPVDGWALQAVDSPGVTLQPAGDGWRLCAPRPGRHTVTLQHRFNGPTTAAAVAWPVATDLTAL